MKRNVLFFGLILIVTGFAVAQVKAGNTLYVAVKTLALKSGTEMFAGNSGNLSYGDKVIVLKVDGKFVEVQSEANPLLTGWTTTNNFSTKKIVAGSTSSTTTAKEVALAGKGFSQEVEDSLKSNKSKNLNYADVDRTEKLKINEKEVKKFLEEGKLTAGGVK